MVAVATPVRSRPFSACLGLLAAVIGLSVCSAAGAAELRLPSSALEQDGPHQIDFRLAEPVSGRGILSVRWTDAAGRLVDAREIPVDLRRESGIAFSIDTRRAVAIGNRLSARLVLDRSDRDGGVVRLDETASASFVATPPDRDWWDYQIIMWHGQTARQYAALKDLGITAGRITSPKPDQSPAMSDAARALLLESDLRWFVENIATDFYSPYHRWTPGRRSNQSYLDAIAAHRADPASLEPFKRQPSLSDPAWLEAIRERLVRVVGEHEGARPLFYNLADEPGIADLAAYWDFDLSSHSLEGMRRWLRERYGSLAALNRQWGSAFTDWDEVMPQRAADAIRRTDGNYSAWADFRAWMDLAFARAVRTGTEAVHSVAPHAVVAIEGGQFPGTGGYDYTLLAEAANGFELYHFGRNVEIVRSLNPQAVVLNTSFQGGPAERHRVWSEALNGARGLILWDGDPGFVTADGGLGPLGLDARASFAELRGGLGAFLISGQPVPPTVAILYSPASQRTRWILDQTAAGPAGLERAYDSDHPAEGYIQRLDLFCRALDGMGVPFRLVSPKQVEEGTLGLSGPGILILPQALSLSPGEARAIRSLAGRGTLILADDEPGTYDSHSRRLDRGRLDGLFAGADDAAARLVRVPVRDDSEAESVRLAALLRPLLSRQGAMPPLAATDPSGAAASGVKLHLGRNGGVTLVGLIAAAAPAGDDLPPSRRLDLHLPAAAEVYDVRSGSVLGRLDRVAVTLDAAAPAIFALSERPLPAVEISAPTRLRRGETGELRLGFAGSTPLATPIFRLEVIDPAGAVARRYSGPRRGQGGVASSLLPIAVNDAVGTWQVRATDIASGRSRTVAVEVID